MPYHKVRHHFVHCEYNCIHKHCTTSAVDKLPGGLDVMLMHLFVTKAGI